jgi:tetratricopeptide (TPR) repeat protein
MTARMVIALTVLGAALCFHGRAFSEEDPSVAALRARVKEELGKVVPKPRTVELPGEKAIKVRGLIARGDYKEATSAIAAALAESRLQAFSFFPFNIFIAGVPDLNAPQFEAKLSEWVREDKESAIPRLVRAQYFHDIGWKTRGSRFMSEIQAKNGLSFANYMAKAGDDIEVAIRLDSKNPYAQFLRLRILLGGGNSPKMEKAFREAIARHPAYYALYSTRLLSLTPKWGGDLQSMYAFTEEHTKKAGKHSPLTLLHLDLYRRLIEAAWVACSRQREDAARQCTEATISKFATPEVETRVHDALDLYNHVDKQQYNKAAKEILLDIASTPGTEKVMGWLLQVAAEKLGGSTELHGKNPGHNNYVLDMTTASIWAHDRHHDNAEQKYKEAAMDILNDTFASEVDRDLVLADVYERLAGIYKTTSQYPDVIIYGTASEMVGGVGKYAHLICYAYLKLKDYPSAVDECTKVIENSGELEAHYWRGRAYSLLGKKDEALADFGAVADSENEFRTRAAIDMSVIYGDRGDMKGQLAVLNKYPYLYDEKLQEKDDLAVVFNNRCYAYMQLGELEKALEDCNKSLVYGDLPDAHRKQQELVKRIAAKGAR